MNVEIRAEAALFPEKEYINGIAVAVHSFQDLQTFWEYLLWNNKRVSQNTCDDIQLLFSQLFIHAWLTRS